MVVRITVPTESEPARTFENVHAVGALIAKKMCQTMWLHLGQGAFTTEVHLDCRFVSRETA